MATRRHCLEKALEISDWGGFAGREEESKSRGKLRGIGLSTYVEACGLAPSRIVQSLGARAGIFESATVRVHVTGDVTVLIGTHNHGQGHETTFAQIVSEKLSIPTDKIEIVFGDTDRVQFGLGTYGSRSLAVGGTALSKATDKIIAKGTKIAAHMLEVGESDIVFENGSFTVQGTDRARSFGDVVGAAYGLVNFPIDVLEPGMEAQAFYDPVNFTYPGGAHIAEVEIDPDCGSVDLVSYVAVDDIGTVINPPDRCGAIARRHRRRGSARPCSRTVSMTRHRARCCRRHSWTIACRAPTTCRTCRSSLSRRCARIPAWASKAAAKSAPLGRQRP